MKKIGRFFVLFCVLILSLASGAAVTVQSSVDRNELGLGDTFTLSVVVVATDNEEIQEPRAPELDGFELLNSWQSSAVAQKMVNTGRGMEFQTQNRREFHYQMNPTRTGTLSVSSFEIVAGGKVFRTQPVVIKVSNEATARTAPSVRKQAPGVGMDPFDMFDRNEEDLFNQLLQQRQRLLQQLGQQSGAVLDQFGNPVGGAPSLPDAAFRSLPTNPNDAFFISVEVDKTEVYEGEQLTVNWYLYTRGQMETLDRLKFPSLRGFWKEIIEEVPSIQFYQEVVNGIPWKKALLASHALFPIKAGTAVIDEYKIKSRVRTVNQIYGGFGSKPSEYTKSSARVPIKVKPLPVEGRPSDFSGAVGQFEINSAVEQSQLPVNQPFSLKIRFEGAGNAKLIELPALNLNAGLEQYDTKSDSKFFKNGRSYKEFEVLLIPRQEGEVEIPAISVGIFDPQTGKYVSKKTQPLIVTVVNNPNAPVGSSSRISMKGPIKLGPQLPTPFIEYRSVESAQAMQSPLLWVGTYGVIVLGLLGRAAVVFGWGRRRATLRDRVKKRLKKAEQLFHKNNVRGLGAEVTNLYYLVLGELPGAGGASQELKGLLKLAPASLRREHGDAIEKNFEFFQTLSFAPDELLRSLGDTATLKLNLQEARELIHKIIPALDHKSAE